MKHVAERLFGKPSRARGRRRRSLGRRKFWPRAARRRSKEKACGKTGRF